MSYALAIGPHLLTGRKNVPQGPFWLGSAGYAINAISVLLIIFFDIMFCFRKSSTLIGPPTTYRQFFRSIRIPNHRIKHELQQRDPSGGAGPHHSMVVHPRSGQIPGAEAVKHVCGRAHRGDAEGRAYRLGVAYV